MPWRPLSGTPGITRRKLMASLTAVGAAGALTGVGAAAFLEDRESFPNNLLRAGALDVEVECRGGDGECHGETNHLDVNFDGFDGGSSSSYEEQDSDTNSRTSWNGGSKGSKDEKGGKDDKGEWEPKSQTTEFSLWLTDDSNPGCIWFRFGCPTVTPVTTDSEKSKDFQTTHWGGKDSGGKDSDDKDRKDDEIQCDEAVLDAIRATLVYEGDGDDVEIFSDTLSQLAFDEQYRSLRTGVALAETLCGDASDTDACDDACLAPGERMNFELTWELERPLDCTGGVALNAGYYFGAVQERHSDAAAGVSPFDASGAVDCDPTTPEQEPETRYAISYLAFCSTDSDLDDEDDIELTYVETDEDGEPTVVRWELVDDDVESIDSIVIKFGGGHRNNDKNSQTMTLNSVTWERGGGDDDESGMDWDKEVFPVSDGQWSGTVAVGDGVPFYEGNQEFNRFPCPGYYDRGDGTGAGTRHYLVKYDLNAGGWSAETKDNREWWR